MIDRRQLSEALARLDPRDREVLDYSLRRHVPDADLAAIFGCGPSDVARMRAGAVERLADDLGVQRGADLGQVLTALLEADTWSGVPPATPLGDGEDAPAAPAAESPAPLGDAAPGSADATAVAGEPGDAESPPAGAAEPSPVEPAKRPVLGMLAGGRRTEPSLGASGAPGGRRWSLVLAAAIGALVAVGLGSIVVLGDDAGSEAADADPGATRPFEPHAAELGEPFPAEPQSAYRYPVATVEGQTVLHDAPGGRRKLRIAPETEWGSPRVLSVVERKGEWLAVLVPELPNGEVGWLRESDAAGLDTVAWAVKADLAKREVTVERDGEVVRRFPVGIGREDHPTPTGRYAVTDKLRVNDPASPYGCCVVALTGHQPELPPGWPGGDRLAIHATADLSGIGEAVSLGCLRADPKDARWLMKALAIGTPVFIEAGEREPARRTTSRKRRAKR